MTIFGGAAFIGASGGGKGKGPDEFNLLLAVIFAAVVILILLLLTLINGWYKP